MVRNNYTLSLISESLHGAKIFRKQDLWDAYNLIQIHLGDDWKMTFHNWYASLHIQVIYFTSFYLTDALVVFQQMANRYPSLLLGYIHHNISQSNLICACMSSMLNLRNVVFMIIPLQLKQILDYQILFLEFKGKSFKNMHLKSKQENEASKLCFSILTNPQIIHTLRQTEWTLIKSTNRLSTFPTHQTAKVPFVQASDKK
jgi:hypothetical protein